MIAWCHPWRLVIGSLEDISVGTRRYTWWVYSPPSVWRSSLLSRRWRTWSFCSWTSTPRALLTTILRYNEDRLVTITCLHSFPARFIVFYICVCLFLTRSGLADHSILTKCKFMRRLVFDACSAATVFTTTTRWVPASFRRDQHPLQGSRRPIAAIEQCNKCCKRR